MTGKLKLLAITFCFIFLAGCTEKELKIPLEDVGMVGVLAFDYIDDEQLVQWRLYSKINHTPAI